jgi:hypothetical protein
MILKNCLLVLMGDLEQSVNGVGKCMDQKVVMGQKTCFAIFLNALDVIIRI